MRGRDIKRYQAKWADLWLIFIPWHFPLQDDNDIKGASIKAENAFIENYPAIYSHLYSHRDRLSKRNKAETGIRYEWYALQRYATTYYKEFEKEKIIYPNMTKYLPFIYDTKGYFINDKAFILFGESLKYIVSLLNSKVIHFWLLIIFPELQGGTRELRKIFFVNTPIPKIPMEQQQGFETLVNYILYLKPQQFEQVRDRLMSKYLEQVIDGLVYELYFEDLLKQHNRTVREHLGELPSIEGKSETEKMAIVRTVFNRLDDKKHPVRNSLFYMKNIPEIAVIEEKTKM